MKDYAIIDPLLKLTEEMHEPVSDQTLKRYENVNLFEEVTKVHDPSDSREPPLPSEQRKLKERALSIMIQNTHGSFIELSG